MSPWNSLTTRIAAIPLGFIAGAVLALVWTGGHGAKSRCGAHGWRAAAGYHGSYPAPEAATARVRSITVPAGKELLVKVDGGLKSVVHDLEATASVEVTALEGDRLLVRAMDPGQASVVVRRLDGGVTTYEVQVVDPAYQPYRSPCQKRKLGI